MSPRKPTLVFDLDNTLIECGLYYKQAEQALLTLVNQQTSVPEAIVKEIFSAIDVASAKMPDGFARSRFPNSFAAAAAVCDVIQGRRPNPGLMERCWNIGDDVFRAPYELYPKAKEVL